MVEAHYYFILSEFPELSAAGAWCDWHEGHINVSDLNVEVYGPGDWIISDTSRNLFAEVPTEELANKIIERIKQTEILFI